MATLSATWHFSRSISRPRTAPAKRPSSPTPAPTPASVGPSADTRRDYELARRKNLEADTRLKECQARSLEDERQLLSLRRRELELNVENGEIKRGISLMAIVFVGAVLVAQLVLQLFHPVPVGPETNILDVCKLLLSN